MSQPAVYAVIPAAGHSRRMGRNKQFVAVDGKPMLQRVIEQMCASGLAGAAIVTRTAIAHDVNKCISHVTPAPHDRLFVVFNDAESSEMIDSIRIGVRAWRGRVRLSESDGFLVAPGDMPGILKPDIDACIAVYRENPGMIVIARHAQKPGHPMIFPASFQAAVESAACDRGLNSLRITHAHSVRYVDRPAEGVRHDIDTPSDLRGPLA